MIIAEQSTDDDKVSIKAAVMRAAPRSGVLLGGSIVAQPGEVGSPRWWADAGAAVIVLASPADAQRAADVDGLPRDRLAVAVTGVPAADAVAVAAAAAVRTIIVRGVDDAESACALAARLAAHDMRLITVVVDLGDGAWLDRSGTIAKLDAAGVDVAIGGRLLFSADFGEGSLNLGTAIASLLRSDRADGLFTTLAVQESGVALGVVYSNADSIERAVRERRGVYYSRTRGLWYKGETSGATQTLLRVDVDCDRDCLRYTVVQHGAGFCHMQTATCFGPLSGLAGLEQTLRARRQSPCPGSYSQRLFCDDALLRSKLLEEAQELAEARTADDVAWEAADVLYFALAKCVAHGVTLRQVEDQLDRRALRITRRAGDAKPAHSLSAVPLPAPLPAPTTCFDGPAPMRTYQYADLTADAVSALCRRPAQRDADSIAQRVQSIIREVRTRGDAALLEMTLHFDRASLASPVIELPMAEPPMVAPDVAAALDAAIENVRRFHAAQLDASPLRVETAPGVVCMRFARPLDRVGLYVPGGTATLPSTALMLGVPAMVAGCREIIYATPPRPDGSVCPEIAYVAHKVGARKILLAGGAQAIAALAYGTQTVPKCDKICGPGNQYVTAAKMAVQMDSTACVSIDMPAGPSEVLVVADAAADARFVAADLLSQAEHGVDSQVVLVTVDVDDAGLAAIYREVDEQCARLPRAEIVRGALQHSFTVRTGSVADALAFSNAYAPEHLILNVRDAAAHVDRVQHAGSVFLGPYSPESCGDYASGTNHTLPTYGYARIYGGVSTSTFQKYITSQELSMQGIQSIGAVVATLATVEGLQAHRNAVLVRGLIQ